VVGSGCGRSGADWGALWAFKVEPVCGAYLSIYGAEWVRIGVEDILSNTYSETPVERMMTHTAEDLLRYTSAHSISTA